MAPRFESLLFRQPSIEAYDSINELLHESQTSNFLAEYLQVTFSSLDWRDLIAASVQADKFNSIEP